MESDDLVGTLRLPLDDPSVRVRAGVGDEEPSERRRREAAECVQAWLRAKQCHRRGVTLHEAARARGLGPRWLYLTLAPTLTRTRTLAPTLALALALTLTLALGPSLSPSPGPRRPRS